MRKQNKEAKQNIKNCAIEIFFKDSYNNASMRDIAQDCGMTVGNIYRYYKNKEILFDEIVGKCCQKILRLIQLTDLSKNFIKNKIGVNEKNVYKNNKFKNQLLDIISKLIADNAKELYILLNNSAGSKYENIREKVTELIKDTIFKVIIGIDEDKTDIYSYMVVNTLLYILKKYISNNEKLKEEVLYFFTKLFKIFDIK